MHQHDSHDYNSDVARIGTSFPVVILLNGSWMTGEDDLIIHSSLSSSGRFVDEQCLEDCHESLAWQGEKASLSFDIQAYNELPEADTNWKN